MNGWIKLHRSIMNSPTFSKLTAIQQIIAVYLILNANHKDGVWFDRYKNIEVPIKRGQLVLSRAKIVNEWFFNDKEVTEQKVRTALKKLEKLNFITTKSTNFYTLIELINYNVYQSVEDISNQADNQFSTDSQPAGNQVSTTNNKNKEELRMKNKELNKRHNSKFGDSSVYVELSEYYYSKILENNSSHKKPDIRIWAEEIKKLIEIDKRPPEQIRNLIDWVQEDDFEKVNVLSPQKLRKRYDQLLMKMKQKRNRQHGIQQASIFHQGHQSQVRQKSQEEKVTDETLLKLKHMEEEMPY